MIEVSIRAEIDDAVNGLVDMGVDAKKAMRGILTQLAASGRKLVRANMYGSGIGHVNGWLQKHVYGIRRSESHAVVAAPRYISEILERGGTIKAKKAKYLTFKINGEWKKVKSVNIPANKWFTRSIGNFEESGVFKAAVEKGIENVIKKFNKERGVTL